MDDIVIFSKSFEDHIDNLRQVFQCLRSSSISLKLSKCVFASDSVDFLGFELSAEGKGPNAIHFARHCKFTERSFWIPIHSVNWRYLFKIYSGPATKGRNSAYNYRGRLKTLDYYSWYPPFTSLQIRGAT